MNSKKVEIILAIIIMIVGFATVSANVLINGAVSIASNESDLKVYFSKAVENDVENDSLIIDDTHISFTTNLVKLNDEYVLKYDVTNGSTQYDVNPSITVSSYDTDYLKVTNEFDNSLLEAGDTREGILTVKLIKKYDKETDQNDSIEISIDSEAGEKTTIVVDESKFQMTGTLTDSDGNVLANQELVVYSDTPHFVTTDDYGFFYVKGLEPGNHEVYLIGETTEDLEKKSKSEIIAMAKDVAKTSTTSSTLKFKKNKMDGFDIRKEEAISKVSLDLDTDGGEVSKESLSINKYSKVDDIPIPTKSGSIFKGWYYGTKKLTDNTIIYEEEKLTAVWEEKIYTGTVSSVTNGKSSISSFSLKYNESVTLTATPDSGYYIESVTCTNGYTVSGSTGSSVISETKYTISNNSSDNDTVCTIKMHARSYTATYVSKTCTKSTTTTGTWYTTSYHNYTDGCSWHSYECKIAYQFACSCNSSQTTSTSSDCSSMPTNLNDTACYCTGSTSYDCSYYSCPSGGTLSGTTCVF